MELDNGQRRALASFLKSRRKRLSPKAAGLRNTYGRRRTPGLRREELASLAGVSVTWYTWLEQARRIRVSRQVMSSLGRALQLDDVETEYMLRLAGEPPLSASRPAVKEDIPGPYLSLLEQLDPLPAMITNYRFDILAWNHGLCVLFPHFGDLPADQRNSMLMTFEDRARVLYPDWEEHAIQTVALFRAMNAERLVQPEYQELIETLEQRSPYFRHLWEQLDLEPPSPAVRIFDHPVIGRMRLNYVKLHFADVDATMVIHQAEPDERVSAKLRALVEEHQRAVPISS